MRDYRPCPYCNSNLDFDERCDCQDEDKKEAAPMPRNKPQTITTTSSVAAAVSDCQGGAGKDLQP